MKRWAFLLTGAVLLSLLPAGSAALQTSAVKPVNESQESAQWGAPNVKLVGRNWLYATKRGRRLRIRGVTGVCQVTPVCRSSRSR